jgi:hypothetical protein
MSGLGRRLHEGEEGISLVEILVAMVIVGIALTAFASTLTTALASITRDEQLVRATQLAADELEGLRSVEWNDVGFYEDDLGYSSTGSGGEPTVTLGPTRGGAVGPVPLRTITRDGVEYQARLEIVWMDDPDVPQPPAVDPDPNDYKAFRLQLDWNVRDRSFTAAAEATRHPTTDEVPVDPPPPCTPGTIVDFTVTPAEVLIEASNNTAEAVVVTVRTCDQYTVPGLEPVLQAPPLGTVILDPTTSGTADTFRFEFPVGSTNVSGGPGTYTWEVTMDGDTATEDVSFVTVSSVPLTVISVTTDPPTLCIGNNKKLHEPVTMRMVVDGAVSSDPVEFSFTTNSTGTTAETVAGSYVGTDADGNLIWEATITTSVQFASGGSTADATTVIGSIRRVSDGEEAAGNTTSTIVQENNQAACP